MRHSCSVHRTFKYKVHRVGALETGRGKTVTEVRSYLCSPPEPADTDVWKSTKELVHLQATLAHAKPLILFRTAELLSRPEQNHALASPG